MASTELKCSICRNFYTDPIQLECGHNFCRVCIDRVLDTQEGSGGYSCPECKEEFQDRPALQRNITLRNTMENILSAQPDQEESGVLCSHCVDSPVPAVRSCLHCEVSLCDKHLRVHKKSPEHILTDPTLSMESRKCSIHKKILELYCTEDNSCICVLCVIGGHKGHEMVSLDEASEKKKETLRNVLQKLLTKREEMEESVQSLQEHRRKVDGDTERATALFRALRRRLEDLKKRVLREISGRAERVSIFNSISIQKLEKKKEELSPKMRHIEELCNMMDPLTVLQESDTGDLCDTEDGYSSPECREKFLDCPALHRNMKLRNTLENFQSAQPDQESMVFCSHCLDSPVPAVRSCLHCEDYLCEKHLRVHKKSPEHVLCDPTLSMESRKCSVHKKILEYYCTEDDTCICASCCLIGGHKGHNMESLNEASVKKKETLRIVLQKLLTKREKMEERVQSLQEHRRKVEEKATGVTERVTVLFRDLRRRLEDLEKRVLRRIYRRTERVSISIRNMEIMKEELCRKIRHIEELCNMTDPLTVLQESDTGLSDIITEVSLDFYIQGGADILLDVNTANNRLHISDDRKTVSRSDIDQNRPETPERFQYCQVLSSQSFSSGRHYWEVDVGGSNRWRVGMCYPSVDRKGRESGIGNNYKSWCLYRDGGLGMIIHNSNKIPLSTNISSNRVRIYLDYDVGRISFYDLCDPIRHLHTFTTTFTEPLYAGLGVWRGWIKICGGNQEMREICQENGDIAGKMPSTKKPKQGQAVTEGPTKKAEGTQHKVTKEPKQRAAASLARALTRIVSSDGRRSPVGTEHAMSELVEESFRAHHRSSSGLDQGSTIPYRGGTAKTASGQRAAYRNSNTVGATELEKGFSAPLGGEPVGKNPSSSCQALGGKPEQDPVAIPAAASAKTVPDPQPKKLWEKKTPRTSIFHSAAQRKWVPEEPMEESGTEGHSGQKTKGSIERKEPSSTREESDEETASPARKRLKRESAAL